MSIFGIDISPREQKALAFAIVILLGFVLFQAVIDPLLKRQASLNRRLVKGEQQLAEMSQLQEEYRRLQAQDAGLAGRLKKRSTNEANFSLFSFLEKGAAQAQVKKQIAFMKPSVVTGSEQIQQDMVEMKLQAISLVQLVSFLQEVESMEHLVAVRRISLQQNSREQETLDANMQIVTVQSINPEEAR